MKKIVFLLAILVGSLAFFACGGGTDDTIMKQSDEMYATAEQRVQEIEDIDEFFIFLDDFAAQKEDFIHEVVVPAYYVDDSTVNVPNKVHDHIYNRATDYNKVEAVQYAKLIEPYLSRLEKATNDLYNADAKTDKKQLEAYRTEMEESYEAILPYAFYDNVLPELQERFEDVVKKMDSME